MNDSKQRCNALLLSTFLTLSFLSSVNADTTVNENQGNPVSTSPQTIPTEIISITVACGIVILVIVLVLLFYKKPFNGPWSSNDSSTVENVDIIAATTIASPKLAPLVAPLPLQPGRHRTRDQVEAYQMTMKASGPHYGSHIPHASTFDASIPSPAAVYCAPHHASTPPISTRVVPVPSSAST